MSLLRSTWRLVAAVTMIVTSPGVMAETFHPFADPMEFDPDWQFFAPVDVDSLLELSPRKRAHVGWFGTYDRTFLWMSRPNVEASAGTGDFGYGNRYDIGFMRDDRSGWLASFRKIGGPNIYSQVYQERLDRVNLTDTNDPIGNPIQPAIDANNNQLGTRAYLLSDSLNVGGFSNFELNKTWRRTPYRYGGILEPMVGFKYSTFDDLALNQVYDRLPNLISDPTAAPTFPFQVEQLISEETRVKNTMVGGQLGARYFTHIDRWTISGEFRAFTLANFQSMELRQQTFTTEYDGIGIGSTVVATEYAQAAERVTNNEFVLGFETRAEAAYQVTKYISIRGGIDVINLASGIWRGQNPLEGNNRFAQDQDVQMAGYTFGFEINR